MHLISPVENMGTNNVEFINGCANWHGFYEIHHYALEEGLYNFLIYVKLRFVYCTVCQDLLYVFIKKGLVGFFFKQLIHIYFKNNFIFIFLIAFSNLIHHIA